MVKFDRPNVEPLPGEGTATALKQRRLHQHPLAETGLKSTGAFEINGTTTVHRQDRQPKPLGLSAGLTQGPARLRLVMGLQQIVHLPFGEGGITGTHQLFGGPGPALAPVQRPATAVVVAASTGTGP